MKQTGYGQLEELQTAIKYELRPRTGTPTELTFVTCKPLIRRTSFKKALRISENKLPVSIPNKGPINQALNAALATATPPYKRGQYEDFSINELITPNDKPSATAAEKTLIAHYDSNMNTFLPHRKAVPMKPFLLSMLKMGGGGGDYLTSKSPCFDYLNARLRPLNKETDTGIYWPEIEPGIIRTHSDLAHVRFFKATDALLTISLQRAPPNGDTSTPPEPHYLLQGAALSSFLINQLSAFAYKNQDNNTYPIKELHTAGIFYQQPNPTPSPGGGKSTNAAKTKAEGKNKDEDAEDNDDKDKSPASSQSSETTPPRCAE